MNESIVQLELVEKSQERDGESNRQSDIMMSCPSMMDPPIPAETTERAQIAGSTITIRVPSTADTLLPYRIGISAKEKNLEKKLGERKKKKFSDPHLFPSLLR